MNPALPIGQRGAALLVALLAVALATVLATGLIQDQRRTLSRTQALTDAERTWQFAHGLEGLVTEWVRRARQGNATALQLDGRWSAPFPVPGGSVRVRLLERSGRFNINALADSDPARAERARQGLATLLAALDQDPGLADALHARMRAGGRPLPLIHESELAELPGWTASTAARLGRHLTVLPDPRSRLDINRASAEALTAQLPELGPDAAGRLVAQRPFQRIEDLAAHPDLQALRLDDLTRRISIDGDWYLAHAQVVINDRLYDHYRLLSVSGAGYDARYVSIGIP